MILNIYFLLLYYTYLQNHIANNQIINNNSNTLSHRRYSPVVSIAPASQNQKDNLETESIHNMLIGKSVFAKKEVVKKEFNSQSYFDSMKTSFEESKKNNLDQYYRYYKNTSSK